jgi:hypothetical protein
MIKNIMLLTLTICLTACAGLPQRPEPARTIEVKVPVTVQCLGPLPTKPDLIKDAALILLTPGAYVDALFYDRLDRDIYIAELEAAIEGCKSITSTQFQ